MVVWLLTPLRNIGTRYFFFFFILAVEDPLAVFVLSKFNVVHQILFPVFTLLLLFTLVSKKNKLYVTIALIFYFLFILLFNYNNDIGFFFNAFLHVAIFIVLLSDFLSFVDEKRMINLFLILLVSYEFIAISKNIFWLIDILHGKVIFFISAFLQIFLGITFTIWNVNNSPKFKIKGMDT